MISDLKAQGYNIKEKVDENNAIKGIEVSKEEIIVKRNTVGTNTYTFVYSGNSKERYFVEVEGKDYEIFYEDEKIVVSTEPIDIEEIGKKPGITVESSNSNIIEAEATNDGEITLIAKDIIGDVEIIIRESKSGVTKKFNATTKVLATNLIITPNSINIAKGTNQQLRATVQPIDTTEEIKWTSSNPNIVEISNEGVIIAKNGGIATITATCGSNISTCNVEVYVKLESKSVEDIKIVGGNTGQLNITVTPNTEFLEELVFTSASPSEVTVNNTGGISVMKNASWGKKIITISGKYSTDVKETCIVTVLSEDQDLLRWVP